MGIYKLEKFMDDQAIQTAAIDMLRLAYEDMSRKFDELASDKSLPYGAKPLWCLSWEYNDAN